jgi:antitoxin MazE
MTTKVQKWGNSLAVRLPKEFAEGLRLREGGEVVLVQEGDALILRKGKKAEVSLASLLKKVNVRNLHGKSDWGKPKGREVW